MAIAQRSPGDDIYFSIKKRVSVGVYRDLDTYYVDILVYVSIGATKIKFAKIAKTGYITLKRISATEYAAFLTSEQTTLLDTGHVTISTDFIKTNSELSDSRENRKSKAVAIYLDTNPLQLEV